MAYIRQKKIGNNFYSYEQKSVRVGDKVKTIHVKYIGAVGNVSKGLGTTPQMLQPPKVKPQNNFKVGDSRYMGDTENISFERFDLSQAKLISKGGSDRIVYELPDGKIIKIARNPRGLMQNNSEGESFLGMIPKCHEKGIDYAIVDNIKRDDKKSTQMLKGLKKYNSKDFKKHTSPLQAELRKLDDKYPDSGFVDVMNYDILYNDFTSSRNWGWKDNKPYMVDAGTLNENVTKDKPNQFLVNDWEKVKSARRVNKDRTILK